MNILEKCLACGTTRNLSEAPICPICKKDLPVLLSGKLKLRKRLSIRKLTLTDFQVLAQSLETIRERIKLLPLEPPGRTITVLK
jgi:hypothetical protein